MAKKNGTYPTNKQLWTVELQSEPKRKIYMFAERWFDVREASATIFNTQGSFTNLFISAVMDEAHKLKNAEGIFEVIYTGFAANGTLQKHVKKLKMR